MAPMTPAALTTCSINMTVSPAAVFPLSQILTIAEIINFAAVTNAFVASGTYTPNNDTKTIKTFATGENFNFIMLIVDKFVNMSLTDANLETLFSFMVNKIFLATCPTDPYQPQNIILDGRSSGVNQQMPVGTPVNWSLILGTATIS